MGKQSVITQELANAFPEWSKIRTDKESVGHKLLNCFANEIEELEHALIKIEKNNHITTCNLDEIDQIYKVSLPNDFAFKVEEYNNNSVLYAPPHSITAEATTPNAWHVSSGKITSDFNVMLKVVEEGNIKGFWEESLPDRLKVNQQIAVSNPSQVILISDLDSFTGFTHPLATLKGGGKFYFTLDAGHPYFRKTSEGLLRARIKVSGITRKGLEETEVISFPWKSRIASRKEWKVIESITAFDVAEEINVISAYNSDSSTTPSSLTIDAELTSKEDYLSLTNLRWDVNRRKVDEFWGLLNVGGISLLERAEYATAEWRMLLKGFTEKVSKERWVLLDEFDQTLTSLIDLELCPFSNNFWAIDTDYLYYYSLDAETSTSLDILKGNPTNPKAELYLETPDVVKGEELIFNLNNSKPLYPIDSYTVWYQNPGDATKNFFPDGGTDVSMLVNERKDRIVYRGKLDISQIGEYILGATIVYTDGSTQTIRKIVGVKSKRPLRTFSLIDLNIGNSVEGLFFDSDQKLWIKANSNYYEIGIHKDVALIDYNRKVIYLHENYESLTVNYPD